MAKQPAKDVPNKVNVAQHCPDEVLLKQSDVGFGFRHQGRWTQATRDTRCSGDDRTFDKIVAGSIARENYEIERERKLKEYFKQP